MLPFFAAVRVFEKMVRASKQCLLLQVLVVCLILVLAPLADGYSCSHEVYGSPTVVFCLIVCSNHARQTELF